MGEVGCLKDGNFQNLQGEHISAGSTGTYEGNHADFMSGYLGNLTGTGLTGITSGQEVAALAAIDSADAGDTLAATLVANAVNFMNSTHAGAGAYHLPEATKGTHLALQYTQSPDGATGAHACHTEGGTNVTAGAVFALQVVGNLNGGIAGSAIVTGGTSVAPTTQIINYIPAAATTNGLGTGSIVQFFCPKDAVWLVIFHMAPQGTGATGAFTVAN